MCVTGFSAILDIELVLVAKVSCQENFEEIAEKLQRVRMYAILHFEKNGPLQLFFLCDFMLKVAVDSDQACLICATISSATLRKLSKFEWLRQELHKIAMWANTV